MRRQPTPRRLAKPAYLQRPSQFTVQVSRPAGRFFLDVRDETDQAPVVLLSAGVGLTPMIQGVVVANSKFHNVPLTIGNDWPLRTPGNARTEQFFFASH